MPVFIFDNTIFLTLSKDILGQMFKFEYKDKQQNQFFEDFLVLVPALLMT